jgi:hypothetical protein
MYIVGRFYRKNAPSDVISEEIMFRLFLSDKINNENVKLTNVLYKNVDFTENIFQCM